MKSQLLAVIVSAAALTLPLTASSQSYVAEDVTPSFALGAYLFRGSQGQYAGTAILPGPTYRSGTFQGSVWTDLAPAGSSESWAIETSMGTTVGYAVVKGHAHALLWRGTTGSYSDLHPSGFDQSYAWGIQNREVAGWTIRNPGDPAHAAIWTSVYSDLHPAGWAGSSLFATDGFSEVGEVHDASYATEHAGLWSGSASSFIDLHPAGAGTSWANHTSRGVQVGAAVIGGVEHAMKWTGSAASVVDLSPHGSYSSVAYAIGRDSIVGYYSLAPGPDLRACVLDGPNGFIDLQQFLTGYDRSVAFGIDGSGNITGYARYIPTGMTHAIIWRR